MLSSTTLGILVFAVLSLLVCLANAGQERDFPGTSVYAVQSRPFSISYDKFEPEFQMPSFPFGPSFLRSGPGGLPSGEAALWNGSFSPGWRVSDHSFPGGFGERTVTGGYVRGIGSDGAGIETTPLFSSLSPFGGFPGSRTPSNFSHAPSLVPIDSAADLIRPERSNLTRHNASFETAWEFDSPLSINLRYRWDRWEGESSYWESAPRDEHTPSLGVRISPVEWLNLGLSYSRSIRLGSDNHLMEVNPDEPELYLLPKFSLADRERSKIDFAAELKPLNDLNFLFTYSFSEDAYSNSAANLIDGTSWESVAVMKWLPFEHLALNLNYLHEEFSTSQAGNCMGANSIFQTKDTLDSVGGGLDFVVVPGKLNFISRGSYSIVRSDCKLDNMPGSGELIRFETFLRYRYSDALSIKSGYLFETADAGRNGFFLRDPLWDGIMTLSSGYKTHVAMVVLNYEF